MKLHKLIGLNLSGVSPPSHLGIKVRKVEFNRKEAARSPRIFHYCPNIHFEHLPKVMEKIDCKTSWSWGGPFLHLKNRFLHFF